MSLAEVTLDDKYTLKSGRVYLTGIQALVRLPMMQRRRDLQAGHDTAGYISGYRGSPLGGYDLQLQSVTGLLAEHQVRFQPGVNEDLAATAVWGTQQSGLSGEGRYDGVFGIWYGKGPGVDRSGDALRHANLAGTDCLGGVLALLGDDHTCESSTTAHQSEYAMVDAMIPVLNPGSVQDILDFGLYGWAMSRYSGCWVALKCVHDTVESTASVCVDPERVDIRLDEGFSRPEGGLNIRWPDTPQQQEARLHTQKLDAVRAFCRANALDRIVVDAPHARIGIATTGKTYLEVRQALEDLGLDDSALIGQGVRLYKIAMSWPLEPAGAIHFADGLEMIVVVEEKRGLIEPQLKELLYGTGRTPGIIGKRDERGRPLFPSNGRLDTNRVAYEIGRRILRGRADGALAERVEDKRRLLESPDPGPLSLLRTPYFCAGCPHNSSTRVPAGSRALAGIGCHYMVQWMDRDTARFTQMGAEGASWIGEAGFSTRPHIFQNVGDGTYFHSGLLAIRAAVASGVNITFKILYNDAVAMTGGQPMDGPLTVPQLTRQVHCEGVRRVVVVSDEPHKYPASDPFAAGTGLHHRDELDAVQRQLRDVPGTTVLVYDQTCAAEKRRRRKRGLYPDPPQRVIINEAVCEGCGDCGEKSNCVALVPVETPLGRKRAVDQSACNKDFSCLKGFCPSFVTVHGGRLRKGSAGASLDTEWGPIPEPELPTLAQPYGIVVTGVGGTGVITVGAVLGMAAHLEGKGCSVIDMTGLAQKGGSVTTHLRIGATPEAVQTPRVSAGGAALLLGCDALVAGAGEALATIRRDVTRAVINRHEVMTGAFTRSPDLQFPNSELEWRISAAAGGDNVDFLDATMLATALLGDSIAGNLFMVGYAWQKGLIPVSAAAIDRAIELNGVAVQMNRSAILWGRRAAEDVQRVQRLVRPSAVDGVAQTRSTDLDGLIEHRMAYLEAYQGPRYAQRWRRLVEQVQVSERERCPGLHGLVEAVAKSYFRLLAYKDEYEVARLYSDGHFSRFVEGLFEGDYSLRFHLAPPLLNWTDPSTGEPRKLAMKPWMMGVFRLLAWFKWLRGTPLDVFGYSSERRLEQALIREYEGVVAELLERLSPESHCLAVEIVALPQSVRGFGPVKARRAQAMRERLAELLAKLRGTLGCKAAV